MGLRIAILSIAVLLAAVCQHAQGACAPQLFSQDQSFSFLKISDLRSAYLQRAGLVRYDGSNATPDGLRQQLQRHFDVVLSLLRFATPNSIEIALDRLQAADNHSWTTQERHTWREKLLAARLTQLQRLATYRDRGIFPLNEGQSTHAVPIFVDRHGTACAVGHLMRCSGWEKVVDSIQKSNNLVYVPDAAHSAIAKWVLTSGLTLEEAALIQPDYYWGPGQFDASAYGPGGLTLQQGGLLFSNFQLQGQNYLEPSGGITSSGTTPTIAGLGLSAGQGTYNPGDFPQHVPIGTNWIAIGGTTSYVQSPLHSLNALAAAGHGQLVDISFDVTTASKNQAINGIAQTSYAYWQGFSNPNGTTLPSGATYNLDTTALETNASSKLAEIQFNQSTAGSYFSTQSAKQSFEATQSISVESKIWVENGIAVDTFILDFNVVPEPGGAIMLVALVATFGVKRKRAATQIVL